MRAVYRATSQVRLGADQQVRGLAKSPGHGCTRADADGRRADSRRPVSGATRVPYDAGRRQDSWVRNDIKPGVPSGHGTQRPAWVAEGRHAVNVLAEAPATPTKLRRPRTEHAAGVARPWPSVKPPTVRTDRSGARIPSAIRPWTPRHSRPQCSKVTPCR